MTRSEFGRIKKNDILYTSDMILYTVSDIEQFGSRTIKCVAIASSKKQNKIVSIDEADCSKWNKV